MFIMQDIPSSTCLSGMSYDSDKKLLLVRFHSGSSYLYYNVQDSEVNDIMNQALVNKEGHKSVGATWYYEVREVKSFHKGF